MDLMAGLTDLFAAVVQMSLTGSIVILLVCLARLLLKRLPSGFHMSFGQWCCSGCSVRWRSHLLFH